MAAPGIVTVIAGPPVAVTPAPTKSIDVAAVERFVPSSLTVVRVPLPPPPPPLVLVIVISRHPLPVVEHACGRSAHRAVRPNPDLVRSRGEVDRLRDRETREPHARLQSPEDQIRPVVLDLQLAGVERRR